MNPGHEDFANAMGDTFAMWNLPRTTGRVYGYLLLRSDPASAESLRSDLSLSAGAVSVAVRELVSWGLAKTIPQPGSRRLLVSALGDFEQLLVASHMRIRKFIDTLRQAKHLSADVQVESRLDDVIKLFVTYVTVADQAISGQSKGQDAS